MTQNFRLRSLLIAALVGSNILLLILSSISLQNSREQHELRAKTQTQNIAKALDQTLSNSIGRIELTLSIIADELQHQLAVGGIDESAMNAFIARQEQRLPEVEAFRIANADGLVILGKGLNKKDKISWADREYFIHLREHADAGMIISKPAMGRVAKKLIIGVQYRYNTPDGRFAGVISAPLELSHFSELLSQFNVGPHGTIVLRDSDGGLIARAPAIPDKPIGQIGNTAFSAESKAIFNSKIDAETYFAPTAADGYPRIISFNRLNKLSMLLVVGAASEDYLTGWYKEITRTLVILFGYLLLSLLLGGFILRLLKSGERDKEVLSERELRLKTIIDNEPECIKLIDSAGDMIEMNPAGLAMIEADTLDQVILKPVVDLIAPEYRAIFADMHKRIIAGESIQMTYDIIGLKGGRRTLETHAVPIQIHNQTFHLAITRDITGRKQAEAELYEHQQHLEQLVKQRTTALMETEARASHIVQSSADGLYGVDINGLITFINPAACELLGYTAEQVIGRFGHKLFHHSKADGSPYSIEECPSHKALRLGDKVRVDNEVYWHADGHPVPVMYAIHPIVQNNQTAGAVISFVDMSAQRAATQARERALIAAENLARVRSEFLANMSHEIRTPLNGVLGFAEIGLRNYQDNEKARNAFSKIVLSGKRLLGVINDILDFSKMEAGKLHIEQTEVSLPEVIDHALDLVHDRADTKQLDLRLKLAPDLPKICLSDPLRIGQVLLNILSNAIKFTEQGHVELSVSCSDSQLIFKITDTGIGMTESQLSQLFTPFQQADASATRRFGGTGLGLAISKHILTLMHGEIRVESQLGSGTNVEFKLPYVAANQPTISPENIEISSPQKPLAGISFLVAEDEIINQEILKENLFEDGARVVMVNNGREAVERFIADGRDAYDVVLLDIQMPEMDGYEAARRILELAPDMPIIAQTAHAFGEERDKCLAAGMLGHVAKPFDPKALQSLIKQYVTKRTAG